MAYSGLIWVDGVGGMEFAYAVALTLGVIIAFAFVLENRVFCALHPIERLTFMLAIGLMLYHDAVSDWIGLALLCAAGGWNFFRAAYWSRSA